MTNIFIPHLKPLAAAQTPLFRDKNSKPSTLDDYCDFGLTNFKRASEEINQARLYQRNLFDGILEVPEARPWTNAFYEHLRANFNNFGVPSFEDSRESLTHN